MIPNVLGNLACAVSRAKLTQILNTSYNIRFPILLTEMLCSLVYVEYTFDIFWYLAQNYLPQLSKEVAISAPWKKLCARVGSNEVRSSVSFLPYIATMEASPHQRAWTEMQQSWKDWASTQGIPLHPRAAGEWSPCSPLSLCPLSYCWPLMGSISLAHPRFLSSGRVLDNGKQEVLEEGLLWELDTHPISLAESLEPRQITGLFVFVCHKCIHYYHLLPCNS